MNATNVKRRGCGCDVLITSEAQNLKEHRGSCVGWCIRDMHKPRKQRAWGQPKSTLESIHCGLFYFPTMRNSDRSVVRTECTKTNILLRDCCHMVTLQREILQI